MSPLIVYCLLPTPEKNPGRCQVSPKNPSELFQSFARNFSQHGDQGNITHEVLDAILEKVNETFEALGQDLTRKKVRESTRFQGIMFEQKIPRKLNAFTLKLMLF